MILLSSFLGMLMLAGAPGTDTGQRKILLFARDVSDETLSIQQNIFKTDPAGLKERQIVVTVVTAMSDKNTYQSFLREGKGFLFVLYGKDGGKKFSSHTPVALGKLYGIIDSMPMRQDEMKQKEAGKSSP